jgi:hypothetical protein
LPPVPTPSATPDAFDAAAVLAEFKSEDVAAMQPRTGAQLRSEVKALWSGLGSRIEPIILPGDDAAFWSREIILDWVDAIDHGDPDAPAQTISKADATGWLTAQLVYMGYCLTDELSRATLTDTADDVYRYGVTTILPNRIAYVRRNVDTVIEGETLYKGPRLDELVC